MDEQPTKEEKTKKNNEYVSTANLFKESKFMRTTKRKENEKKRQKTPKEQKVYKMKYKSKWIENRLTTSIYCSIEPDELCYLCVRQTTHISFRSRKYLMWWNSHCHFVVTLSQYVRTFIAPIICSHLMYYSLFSLSLCFFLRKRSVLLLLCYSHFFFHNVHGANFNGTDFKFQTKI